MREYIDSVNSLPEKGNCSAPGGSLTSEVIGMELIPQVKNSKSKPHGHAYVSSSCFTFCDTEALDEDATSVLPKNVFVNSRKMAAHKR